MLELGRLSMLLALMSCLSPDRQAANGGLGQARFSYVCPDATSVEAPSADAWCQGKADSADSRVLPDVAVGAPFALHVDSSSSGGPQPAVGALASATEGGWSLVQPGWLGFVAWSGADVLDFTHVRGRPVASLAWQPDPPTTPLGIRAALTLAVLPLAGDGTTLGGAIACTFAVSDPTVASVIGTGRVAKVVAVAGGDVTLSASCMGVQTQVPLRVTAAQSAPDASDATDASDGGVAVANGGPG